MFALFRSGLRSIQQALTKTRSFLGRGLQRLFGAPLDGEAIEQLERLLYEADFGVKSASVISLGVAEQLKGTASPSGDQLIEALRQQIRPLLPPPGRAFERRSSGPLVVCVVGVNGNGKTTTIAKLAHAYQDQGWKVVIAAADTFRAAAIEQLGIWAQRLGCDLIRGPQGGDPAAVAFDACQAAQARAADLLLIDTAGRLQNKEDLMAELAKVHRVCGKAMPGAPHETLLVVEATTGQNALDQASSFHAHTPLTGVVITKLDGTAKGGMALSLYQQCRVPVRWLGTGEQVDDLVLFDPDSYLAGILASGSGD
jgi:fused signal recognition particle receptor